MAARELRCRRHRAEAKESPDYGCSYLRIKHDSCPRERHSGLITGSCLPFKSVECLNQGFPIACLQRPPDTRLIFGL